MQVSASRPAAADLKRYLVEKKVTPLWALGTLLSNQGLQAVLVYRFGQMLNSRRHRILLWPLLSIGWLLYCPAAWLTRICYGIHLSLTAHIGAGFLVAHFGGVEVTNCRIGAGCSIGHQTKIGRTPEPDGPQIGDGVWIGAHSKIFGPVRIGDNATIAPGTCVKKNVPRRSLVVGNPGRIVSRSYDNRHMMTPRVVTWNVESGAR